MVLLLREAMWLWDIVVMGHLSEMFSSASKEKVDERSNVTMGHKPSG